MYDHDHMESIMAGIEASAVDRMMARRLKHRAAAHRQRLAGKLNGQAKGTLHNTKYPKNFMLFFRAMYEASRRAGYAMTLRELSEECGVEFNTAKRIMYDRSYRPLEIPSEALIAKCSERFSTVREQLEQRDAEYKRKLKLAKQGNITEILEGGQLLEQALAEVKELLGRSPETKEQMLHVCNSMVIGNKWSEAYAEKIKQLIRERVPE